MATSQNKYQRAWINPPFEVVTPPPDSSVSKESHAGHIPLLLS